LHQFRLAEQVFVAQSNGPGITENRETKTPQLMQRSNIDIQGVRIDWLGPKLYTISAV